MSQENVEVMKAFFEAWNAGDMDAVRELHDPDVIVRMPEGWPEPGPYVGREAVMRQWEQQRETLDADGAGQGPESNIVVTLREGKVVRTETHPSRQEALEAVGLREDDSSASA